MTQRRRLMISASALFITLGFLVIGIAQSAKKENFELDNTDIISEPASASKEQVIPPQEKYVLKIEDGIVVVFNETDMTRPIIVTDIYAGTLRHLDRKKLTDGVVAVGEFELQTILEDFSS